MAPLFIHTIIISQKRNTVDFIQVSFIVWSAVESIGVVKIEHHRQDGKGAERHKIVKEIIAT
jgi:hypothetical protein